MKKPLVNSKNSWQNDIVLKTQKERELIEYLVEKKKIEHGKFSTKCKKFFKKIF